MVTESYNTTGVGESLQVRLSPQQPEEDIIDNSVLFCIDDFVWVGPKPASPGYLNEDNFKAVPPPTTAFFMKTMLGGGKKHPQSFVLMHEKFSMQFYKVVTH